MARRKQHKRRPAESSTPAFADGHVDGTIRPSAQQMSTRELSARAVQQRFSMLGEITAGIVHDFRNILAVIDSALRLAEHSSGDPEKVRTYIAGAREGLERGSRLTSQLLRF